MTHQEAFKRLMGHEGFYSNDPNDRGGETIYGIARKAHPSWDGWIFVDDAKHKPDFPENLKTNYFVKDEAIKFYKIEFWDKLKCEQIPEDTMQYELYDTAVNQGVETAAKMFQEALNLCNRNQLDYPDIKVDGDIGNATIAAYLMSRRENIFITVNLLQGERYLNIVRRDPSQEKYFNGWLSRVTLSKT